MEKALLALAQLLMGANTLMQSAQALNALIIQARKENRDVSDAELDALAASDDAAREALENAIRSARG